MSRDDHTVRLLTLLPYRQEGLGLPPFVGTDRSHDLVTLLLSYPTLTRAPSTEFHQSVRTRHKNHG